MSNICFCNLRRISAGSSNSSIRAADPIKAVDHCMHPFSQWFQDSFEKIGIYLKVGAEM